MTGLAMEFFNTLLKILHIDPERNWGGGEVQVLGLLTYLTRQGHGNHLLTHPSGRLFQESRNLKINTLPLVVRNDLDVSSIPGLRRLIRDEAYDVVHLHTKRAHALSLWLPRIADGPRYVVTRRMDYPERQNWYTRHLYNRRVDGVIAISRDIVNRLVTAGVEREKIRLIHSGIDPLPFQCSAKASCLNEDGPVVGTAAVLEERKGHRYLFQAAALLKQKGHRIKYMVAGEGSLREELQELARGLELKQEVTFLGFVDDMPKFLSKIDIFVLPSLHEGLGVAALEAMAAGKPVVASRVGGLAEIVIDTDTGFLVPPKDAEALAEAIRQLSNKTSMAEIMGSRAADRVQQHFTMEQMARKNEAYYYELLGGNSPSPFPLPRSGGEDKEGGP
ncbi:MAG TPA: glycosyltransferase family 4 protein [Candidatus Binatia bacterium]|nr:glycosyltransferase family 4 protein [Candidatus Binatia bacterium]